MKAKNIIFYSIDKNKFFENQKKNTLDKSLLGVEFRYCLKLFQKLRFKMNNIIVGHKYFQKFICSVNFTPQFISN